MPVWSGRRRVGEYMIISITGSRSITSQTLANEIIERAIQENNLDLTEVVSGGAPGFDTLAENWAKANGILFTPFPADWKNLNVVPCVIRIRHDGTTYNAAAGSIRNRKMAEYVQAGIIAWDGVSNGTRDMMKLLGKLGKTIYIYRL